jgi:hypothetical protein
MQILFHHDAQAELIQGTNINEANQPSLGYQFAIEILAAAELINANPSMRAILDDQIRLLAVMHLHRQPNYWSGRS